MRRAFVLMGAMVAIASAAAGCGGSGNSNASTTTESVTASPDGLPGIGGSRADWEATHTPDPSKTGAYLPRVFEPDCADECDAYVRVTYDHGLVTNYLRQFSAHTTEEDLAHALSAELPPDAVLTSSGRTATDSTGSVCAYRVYTSATLSRIFTANGVDDTDGVVSVQIDSPIADNGTTIYDPNNIESAGIFAERIDGIDAGCA